MRPAKVTNHHRPAEAFRRLDCDPANTHGIDFDKEAEGPLAVDIARLTHLQQRLFAQHRWAVLIVPQGMNAVGQGRDHQARIEQDQCAAL